MTLASTRARRFLALPFFALAAALSACGGSGGDSDPADPPAPPAATVSAPTITAQPQDLSVPEGLSASFSVTASGSGTLSYQWQRGGADVAGATSATFGLGVAGIMDDQARYRVRVSNAAGSVFSRTATLAVQAAMGNTLALLAGARPTSVSSGGPWDSVDGTGALARITGATSMTSDGTGNIYFTEVNAVRKITPAGEVTTVAGHLYSSLPGAPASWGLANGYGPSARFSGLSGIVVANDGSLYVADRYNSMIRRVSPDGEVRTLTGVTAGQGAIDGPLEQASFDRPAALARDRAGNVYVLDGTSNLCVDDPALGSVPVYSAFKVRKISTTGVVTTLANASVAPSTSTAILLPGAIAVDADDNVYVSVAETKRPFAIFGVGCGSFRQPALAAYVQKLTPAGQLSVVAGSQSQAGAADGSAVDARFSWPSQMAFDSRGSLLVADTDNQAIRRISPNGQVTTPIGQLSAASATAVSLGALPGQLLPVTALAVLPGDTVALLTGGWPSQLLLRTQRH